MMIDLYVLDGNLDMVGIIDSYKSLIWANRYNKDGDCELYLPATADTISLLQMGKYLQRLDDEMICRINRIEIDTDTENGNFLIVNGIDTKSFLNQRVIWTTMTCDGNLEQFIREIVSNTVCTPALTGRQMVKTNGDQLVYLGNLANFTVVNTEQVSYKNVGEKIREYCVANSWGYRFVMDSGDLWFQLYAGTDRSDSVIFSDQYENLASTKYVDDMSKMGNVALVGGAGEGAERARNVYGYAESVDRYEIFVDAKDVARNITWKELTATYPTTDSGGQGYIDGDETNGYTYKMNYINIQIVDSDQLTWLQTNFPGGTVITVDGNQFYQAYNPVIALLPTDSPADDTQVTLQDIIYSVYLLNRGQTAVAEYGEKLSFDGSVIPDVTFIYKKDYFMGDLVTVENEYGISATARITEVVEVMDDNGYSVEPKFEYISTT